LEIVLPPRSALFVLSIEPSPALERTHTVPGEVRSTVRARAAEFSIVSEKLVRAKLTNEDAACLVKSDAVYAMSRPSTSFRRLTSKDIVEAHQMTEALLALQVESKEEVNALLNKALAAGGRAAREAQDMASWMKRSLKTRMVICGTDGRRGFGSGRKRGN
jgi:uncharacterized glyoxalase superfamily protein PhnB